MKFRLCCLLVFFFLSAIFVSALKDKKAEETSMTVKRFSKSALLTIESPDGDLIECIDKRNQPAFNHPLLRDHKIRREPRQWLETKLEMNSNEVAQSWLKNGTRCPKGTIPVRRTTTDNAMTDSVMLEHGMKLHSFYHQLRAPNNHEHAMAVYNVQEKIHQVKAKINVWNPEVEVPNEYSVAKIRLTAGEGAELNVIEAGWHVYPSHYGNSNKTRLFIFTRDASTTECCNLDCDQFIQNDEVMVIGGTIDDISSYNDREYHITVHIYWDPQDGDWWLSVGGRTVGYWPNRIFTSMANPATHVSWGGGVLNLRSHNRHTSTKMGSGHFANEGYKKASYFHELQVMNEQQEILIPVSPEDISQDSTNNNCYNLTVHDSTMGLGCGFFYGGPGYSTLCQ